MNYHCEAKQALRLHLQVCELRELKEQNLGMDPLYSLFLSYLLDLKTTMAASFFSQADFLKPVNEMSKKKIKPKLRRKILTYTSWMYNRQLTPIVPYDLLSNSQKGNYQNASLNILFVILLASIIS